MEIRALGDSYCFPSAIRMERFCRACLIYFDDTNQLVQCNEKNRWQFIYSTGIQVKSTDTFTLQLCKDCIVDMKNSCTFKKKCRNADTLFRNYTALKEAGGGCSFSSFLRQNDLSYTFRYEDSNSMNKNKGNDFNDNESTGTSMMNFVIDLLKDDDDIEASEDNTVKQKEAEIIDDTLDSHWLQDDISVDTDFPLLNFSPFATPRTLPYAPDDNASAKGIAVKVETAQGNSDNNCCIDVNLEKALKRNKVQCSLKDLLLSPSERQGSSTPYYKENDTTHRTVKNLELLRKNIGINNEMDDSLDGKQNNIKGIENEMAGTHSSPFKGCIQKYKQNGNNDNSQKVLKPPRKNLDKFKMFLDQNDVEERVTLRDITHSDDNCEAKNEVKLETNLDNDILDEDVNPRLNNGIPINLQPEIYVYINKDPLPCKKCNKVCETRKRLIDHYKNKHCIELVVKVKYRKKVVTCEVCGKVSKDPSNAKVHRKTHDRDKDITFDCTKCNLRFEKKSMLQNHLSSHDEKIPCNEIIIKDSEVYKYACSKCPYRTQSISNLKQHMRRHEKQFTVFCQQCDKGFYRKPELVRHNRKHNGEKPFPCPHCSKKFVRADYLTVHLREHTGERPYICKDCNATFKQLSGLGYHKRHVCLKADRSDV